MCVCVCVCVCGTSTEAATQPDCQIANINVSGARSTAQQSMLQGFSFLMLPLGLRCHTPPLLFLHLLTFVSYFLFFFWFLCYFISIFWFLYATQSLRRWNLQMCVRVCEYVCVCACVCEQMIWKSCIADLVLLLPSLLSLLSSQLCFSGASGVKSLKACNGFASSLLPLPPSMCVTFKDNAYWTI